MKVLKRTELPQYQGYQQGAESDPLIPLRRADGHGGDSTPTPAGKGLLDEVADLAGLSKRQLYCISVGGVVFKIFAAGVLYLAYKHHVGPWSLADAEPAAAAAAAAATAAHVQGHPLY